MDFIFGCWASRRSGTDCRTVTEAMARFFADRGVVHAMLWLEPDFATGAASFLSPPDRLHERLVENSDAVAVGDVRLYDADTVDSLGNVRRTPEQELAEVAGARADLPALARLDGDFAVAVLDKGSHALTLIRDHCGVLPLHYSQHGETCAFSSLVRPLLLVPWASHELDVIALASFLAMRAAGGERTYYTSAKAVLPACRMVLGGQGTGACEKFWFPAPAAGLKVDNAGEAYDAVREQLVRAVVARTHGEARVGAKLSGGLDSSTITGILCATHPGRTTEGVSGVLPPGTDNWKGDERGYIAAMGRHFANLRISYETAEDIDTLEGAQDWATWCGSPVADPYCYLERKLAETAAGLGVRCLMSGDGGDYCLSARGDAYLAECLLGLRTRPFLQELWRARKARNLSTFGVLRHQLLPHIVPARPLRWARLLRRGPWQRDYAFAREMPRRQEVLQHLRDCGFHEIAGSAARSLSQSERANLAELDTHSPHQESIMQATRRLRVAFPLLDPRLIETCMAVPSRFKVSASLDRMLIRGAGGPFLPAKIAQRPGKGWFSPGFPSRLEACEGALRAGLDAIATDASLAQLIDAGKARGALAALHDPPSSLSVYRLIHLALLPYRIQEFVRLATR